MNKIFLRSKFLSAIFNGLVFTIFVIPIFLFADAVNLQEDPYLPSAVDPEGMIDAPDDEIWFHRLGPPSAISPAKLRQAVKISYRSLRGQGSEDQDFSFLPEDREPRIIFLSWSCGRRRAEVVAGRGYGWRAAMADAVRRGREHGADRDNVNYVKVDVVQKVVLFPRWRSSDHQIPEPGFRGLAFDPATPFAFLPEQLLYGHLFKRDGRIDPMRMSEIVLQEGDFEKLGLFKNIASYTGEQPLFSFDTQGVFFDGRDPAYIYRGHILPDLQERENLRRSTEKLTGFLTRNIGRDGRIDIDSEKWIIYTEHGQHSLMSLALTFWGLARYVSLTGDQEVLSATKRLANRLAEHIQPLALEEDVFALVEFIAADLQTNSYAILAWLELAELTGNDQYRNVAVRLAQFLKMQLQPSGAFLNRRLIPETVMEFDISVNSSAVAVLALVRLYEATDDSQYIRMAQEAMEYLLQQHLLPADIGELPSAPWLFNAVNALYTYNRDSRLPILAERLVISFTAMQLVDNLPFADVIGSYIDRTTTMQVAALTPGFVDGASLLDDADIQFSLNHLLEAIHLNMIFQLQSQLKKAETMYMSSPADFPGAFRDDIRGMNLSLEAQASQLLSLVAVLELMEEKNFDRLPLEKNKLTAVRKSRGLLFSFGQGLPPGLLQSED